MRCAIIVFPGSNCDLDIKRALTRVTGQAPAMVWHKETALPDSLDLVVLPGGFSFGDYLRSGAMSARSPVMVAVKAHVDTGRLALGVCNGFQILTEAGLLPGALLRNSGQRFVCRDVPLEVANANTVFTRAYGETRTTHIPIAHADGRYFADGATLDRLEGEGQITLRYLENPNGSAGNIAGLTNARGNVMGMMPHPERACDPGLGLMGGWNIFQSLLEAAA